MPLHVLALQPSLPAYRVPVFRELASRPGIDLRVCYSEVPNLKNAAPEGFEGVLARHVELWFKSQALVWQSVPRQLMRADWCDCVLLNWNVRYLSLLPTMLKARAMRIPVIVWGHGFSKSDTGFRRWLRTRLIKPADAVVTYNHLAVDELVKAGLPRQRIFVALNSLDQRPVMQARAHWEADPARLTAFKREQGLDKGPVLLFVSRLEPENRVELLIEAAARLLPTYPALTTVIIGKGPHEPELRAHAKRLGVASSVRFLGAIYNEQELAPWFLSARAFVYPTNIGLSLLHALAYGVPVITSERIGAQNPEIEALVPGFNGLTFEHGSVDSLMRTLGHVILDDALHERLVRGASAPCRFTIQRMVDGLEAAIRYATRNRASALAASIGVKPA